MAYSFSNPSLNPNSPIVDNQRTESDIPDLSPSLGLSKPSGYAENESQISDTIDSSSQTALEISESYKASEALILSDREDYLAQSDELYNSIMTGYTDNKIDSGALLKGMRIVMNEQVTRIADSYNNQAARESERIDALIANGALAGNQYRAYQAHAQSSRDITAQSNAQISKLTMDTTQYITSAGIEIAKQNMGLYTETMRTLALISGDRAKAMIGFSDILNRGIAGRNEALSNSYALQLSALQSSNNALADLRKSDISKYNIDVNLFSQFALSATRLAASGREGEINELSELYYGK